MWCGQLVERDEINSFFSDITISPSPHDKAWSEFCEESGAIFSQIFAVVIYDS
jgi:hypothetical protein